MINTGFTILKNASGERFAKNFNHSDIVPNRCSAITASVPITNNPSANNISTPIFTTTL